MIKNFPDWLWEQVGIRAKVLSHDVARQVLGQGITADEANKWIDETYRAYGEYIKANARGLGVDHWIIEGTANRGWYTCILTGKKFRGEDAEALLGHQDAIIERANEIDAYMHKAAVEADIEAEAEVKAEPTIQIKVGGKSIQPGDTKPTAVDTVDDMTERLYNHLVEEVAAGKKAPKTVQIKCVDCGAPRTIKVQDLFQVKRCPACQKKHRNAMRAARRRAKRAAERTTKNTQSDQ